MSANILLVEDEPSLAIGLIDMLKIKGYDVEHVESGEAAWESLQTGLFDLVLLDASLPGISGFEVLKRLRGQNDITPVIMLTARGTESDRVLGFELGTDDYVVKPFSLLELLGRIAALLRRHQRTAPAPGLSPGPQIPDVPRSFAETCAAPTRVAIRVPAAPKATPADSWILHFEDVTVDLKAFTIRKGTQSLTLPTKAFELLRCLAENANSVVDRDQLMDHTWSPEDAITLRTLNNLVVKVRAAIEPLPDQPKFLKTVHGVGYRLEI